MTSPRNQQAASKAQARSSLSKLFKVLVVGGAALAMASALTVRGSTGAPAAGQADTPDGGGTPGW
jgi:hypothetical protein